MQIADKLKRYGFPNREKIMVIRKEKLRIPKDYGDEFNGSSIEVITIKIILEQKKEIEMEMGFILQSGKPRLLRMSTFDQPQD